MDIIIEFFRDTLDGTFYIVWVVVLVILIFACIGYLAEKGIKNKKEKEKYATVSDTNSTDTVQEAVVSEPTTQAVANNVSVESTTVTTPVAETVNTSPTVSEVATTPIQNVNSDVESVSADTASVDNNVVIPTINQDGNNNAV